MKVFVPVMIAVVVDIGWFANRTGENEEQREKMRIFYDSGAAAMTYGRWKENDGYAKCGSNLFSLDRSGRGIDEGLTGLRA
ncbi:MAG: hypothetical protein OXD46_10530 [Chloroflexi bacterium]|nr:hypothetical protein [Chloroflexota bacterium]